jgi:hypothetical protein
LFAQKVDSNFREIKNNCLILAWINISGLRTIGIFSCFASTFDFPYFSNAFSFGAKKEDFFFVTHRIISFLPILSKLICIKVTSTCYIIDIWACVV